MKKRKRGKKLELLKTTKLEEKQWDKVLSTKTKPMKNQDGQNKGDRQDGPPEQGHTEGFEPRKDHTARGKSKQ